MIDTIKNQIEQLNIDNNKKEIMLLLTECCRKHKYIMAKDYININMYVVLNNTFCEDFNINFMNTLDKKRYVITLSINPVLFNEINHETIDNSLHIIIDEKIYKLIDCKYTINLNNVDVEFCDIIQLK